MAANGQLDPATLTPVDGWALLETNTAHAWVNAAAEVLTVTGVRPVITSPIGAYRSYAQQVATKAEFVAAGKGNWAAWPGTSNHGWGTAVDVYNISRFNQSLLDGLMRKHGFVRDVTFESWHYHHVTNMPGDATATAGTTGTPITSTGTDDIMTPEQEAKLDGLVWTVGQMKPVLDELSGGKGKVHAKLDLITWALTDPLAGLRTAVANVGTKLGLVAVTPTPPVNVADLAAALAAILPQGATVQEIETALSDNFAAIPAAVRNAIVK